MSLLSKKAYESNWLKSLLFVFGMVLFCVGNAFATEPSNIGDAALQITNSFEGLGRLMVAVAYVAGFGFVIGAIFKFKQHKDNPTQIPMGTPIALLAVGITLVFIPGVIKMGGATVGLSDYAGGFSGMGATKMMGKP